MNMRRKLNWAVAAFLFAILVPVFISCSDESKEQDEPKGRPFLSAVSLRGYLITLQKNLTVRTEDQKMISCTVKLETTYRNCSYIDTLTEVRNRYYDYFYTGEVDKDMKDYRPLPVPVKRVAIVYAKRLTLEFPEDESLFDHFKVRYKSYHTFLANGYKWPEGDNGPWYEMTLREFKERGGDQLMDTYVTFIADEYVQEKFFASDYAFPVYFEYEDGEVIRGWINLKIGDPTLDDPFWWLEL